MASREAVMSGIKKVSEHAVQVEIDEARPVTEQERFEHQHFLEWNQSFPELGEHGFLLGAPLLDAPSAELPFLVAQKAQLVGNRHHLFPINVIEFKTYRFNFSLDVAP